MKLFRVNENKEFIGFYDTEIHGIKADNKEYFELSDEKWQELLDNQSEGQEIRILPHPTSLLTKEEINMDIPFIGNYTRQGTPEGLAKPEYDYENHCYVETATETEVTQYNLDKSKKFYSEEKEYYELIDLDYDLGLVSEEEMEEAKTYMIAINPYIKETRKLKSINRPSIFDRYL